MAGRFVTFGGQVRFVPGGITVVDATALAPIGLSATGIVGLVGEAEGGTPGEVVIMDDPSLAKATFRSGPLADAIRVAFDPSGDIRVPGGAQRVLAYKVNTVGSLQATTHLPGDEDLLSDTAAGVPTTTVIDLTTNTTMTTNEHVGRWFQLDNTLERRRIVANDANTVTVSPGFNSAPVATDPVAILEDQIILTSRDYGAHTNAITVNMEDGVAANTKVVSASFEGFTEQSEEILGTKYLKLMYGGGAIFDTGTITAIDATGLLVTLDVAVAPLLNAYAGMVLELEDGSRRSIASNTAADPTVITLSAGHALSTDQQTDLIGTTGNVRNVTSATASINGAQGVATDLVSVVAPVADNLSLTFETNETLRHFVDRVNATTNYIAEWENGVNPDTTLMNTFDFGTNSTLVNVRFDEAINPNTTGHFRRDLNDLVAWFNAFSTLVTAERATGDGDEGSELPLNSDFTGIAGLDYISLVGGARGTSTNSTWQTALDAMLDERVQHIIPLIAYDLINDGFGSTATFASVAAQLRSHVQTARGVAQTERGGYLGMEGTLTEVLDQAALLNDTDVQLFPQKFTTLNVNGELTEMPEWVSAVTAAGMRSGALEVGTPLTFKLVKTTDLSQDNSWSPTNLTNKNQLIQGGVMFAEPAPTGGFRWVRDLTTHLLDDNIALIDGNVRDSVRFIAYDLRTFIENRFTGLKAIPATVASIKESTAAQLRSYLNANILVESRDPENPNSATIIPGFRRLRVSVTGNTAEIKVQIFPALGIVFELITLTLGLATIVAP